jgi:NADPH:quinone reductase
MKSVRYKTPGPDNALQSLEDFTTDKPSEKGHVILVEVKAISVNPVDVKIRACAAEIAQLLKEFAVP